MSDFAQEQFKQGQAQGYIDAVLDIWKIVKSLPKGSDEAAVIVEKVIGPLNESARDRLGLGKPEDAATSTDAQQS